jgi:D-tyrosyl-tRNA(Tyr) deacylase
MSTALLPEEVFMRCVVQRVTSSSVTVDGVVSGQIDAGLMVLIGVSVDDTEADLKYMAEKVPNLRIFDDENGVMNRSVLDVGGSILAVSQFTLYGDARGGRRPSYIRAAKPDKADELYEKLIARWREKGIHVETGVFRTEMKVSLVNDGPVTILLDSEKTF